MAICPEFEDNNRSVRITMFVCTDSVVAERRQRASASSYRLR